MKCGANITTKRSFGGVITEKGHNPFRKSGDLNV